MMTKVNALKLVNCMPEKPPVKELIEIFKKLEKMEERQEKTAEDINWKELKEDISNWGFKK